MDERAKGRYEAEVECFHARLDDLVTELRYDLRNGTTANTLKTAEKVCTVWESLTGAEEALRRITRQAETTNATPPKDGADITVKLEVRVADEDDLQGVVASSFSWARTHLEKSTAPAEYEVQWCAGAARMIVETLSEQTPDVFLGTVLTKEILQASLDVDAPPQTNNEGAEEERRKLARQRLDALIAERSTPAWRPVGRALKILWEAGYDALPPSKVKLCRDELHGALLEAPREHDSLARMVATDMRERTAKAVLASSVEAPYAHESTILDRAAADIRALPIEPSLAVVGTPPSIDRRSSSASYDGKTFRVHAPFLPPHEDLSEDTQRRIAAGREKFFGAPKSPSSHAWESLKNAIEALSVEDPVEAIYEDIHDFLTGGQLEVDHGALITEYRTRLVTLHKALAVYQSEMESNPATTTLQAVANSTLLSQIGESLTDLDGGDDDNPLDPDPALFPTRLHQLVEAVREAFGGPRRLCAPSGALWSLLDLHKLAWKVLGPHGQAYVVAQVDATLRPAADLPPEKQAVLSAGITCLPSKRPSNDTKEIKPTTPVERARDLWMALAQARRLHMGSLDDEHADTRAAVLALHDAGIDVYGPDEDGIDVLDGEVTEAKGAP